MTKLKRIAIAALAIVAVLYPLFVYWGMQHLEPKYIGIIVATVLMVRSYLVSSARTTLYTCVALMIFMALLWQLNHEYFLLFLPALISLGFMGAFIYSCLHPPTIPARFAMKFEGTLCTRRLRYTHYITGIWILFFAINALVAICTAIFFSREIWALYTGFISYVLIGLLFAGEYLFRQFILEPRLKQV